MLLRMICFNENNEEEVWHFDNVKNTIYLPDGKVLNPDNYKHLYRFADIRKIVRTNVCDTKSSNVRNLRIQLGLKCNMNCSYCAQGKTEAVSCSPKDIDNLLKKLDEANIDVKTIIELWGGEPLVYWKTLKVLLPKLREKYPFVGFKIITNGTLLTKQKVDFFAKYGVKLICSHDAKGYWMRGKDPLDDPKLLEVWKYANDTMNFSINCVITPANADVREIYPFFKEKFGKDVHVNIEGAMTHSEITSEEIMFSDNALRLMHDSIFEGLLTNDDGVYRLFFGYVASQIIAMVRNVELKPKIPRCSAWDEDSLAINMRGDVLTCHNYGDKKHTIGNILALKDVRISNRMTGWDQREKCKYCHVVHECKGGCPLSSGLEWKMTCRNMDAFHSAIFEFAWLYITGRRLSKIEWTA